MIPVAVASCPVSTSFGCISHFYCAPFLRPNPSTPEPIFTAVLGKYRKVAGLSESELRDVTDYFQIRDGRVAYRQFCKVVCSESKLIFGQIVSMLYIFNI